MAANISQHSILDSGTDSILAAIFEIADVDCATCGTPCGCRKCAMALPCECPLVCDICNKYPCNCYKQVLSTLKPFMNMISNMPQNIIQTVGNVMTSFGQQITFTANQNSTSYAFKPPMRVFTNDEPYDPPIWVDHVDPTCDTCGEKHNCINCSGVIPKQLMSCNCPSRSGLVTGSAYYNSSMLQRGTDSQKLARQRAIEFRNKMLGEDGCRDLYSPDGLCVKSKLWPYREYRFYAHHVSAQVYDYGENVGRLDVHSDIDVPMGDTHLAAILKTMLDEEGMIETAIFSRVRDI